MKTTMGYHWVLPFIILFKTILRYYCETFVRELPRRNVTFDAVTKDEKQKTFEKCYSTLGNCTWKGSLITGGYAAGGVIFQIILS